jgi:hypothetical protein
MRPEGVVKPALSAELKNNTKNRVNVENIDVSFSLKLLEKFLTINCSDKSGVFPDLDFIHAPNYGGGGSPDWVVMNFPKLNWGNPRLSKQPLMKPEAGRFRPALFVSQHC